MRFSLLALGLLPALAAGLVVPRQVSNKTAATCTKPTVRKEWRKLTTDERHSYISAVQCLNSKDSTTDPGAKMNDDWARVHALKNEEVHEVAVFLPWHRHFIHLYEHTLRDVCGYGGPMAYWDWTLDSSNMAGSPIWDPVTGFGGDGSADVTEEVDGSTIRCVADGPFANLRLQYYGSGDVKTPHCLSRQFNDGESFASTDRMMGQDYSPSLVARISALPDFDSFRTNVEDTPHNAVHDAIDGDMSPSTSPSDPLFFLHHAQIDRLWAQWQQADPASRTYAYGGAKTQNAQDPGVAGLDDPLGMLDVGPDLTVRDVMDTRGATLCYTYE